MSELLDKANRALNRLCKWRTVFAGWQLGTRADTDAECRAVRDHRESTLIQRVELTALTRLMIEKKIFTKEEWAAVIADECEEMQKMLERRFPGFKASDVGLDVDAKLAAETTKGWRP
jgi:hypothetical protein